MAAALDDTQALALLLVPAAMLSLWDDAPAVAADQADRAVALLTAASNLHGELLATLRSPGSATALPATARRPPPGTGSASPAQTRSGERHMKALAVGGLGEQKLADGQLEEATALFREALSLKRELGDRMGIAVGLDSLGPRRDCPGGG